MGAIDNLDASEIRALIKRVERLERAAPVGFSTVSRGALIIKSAEGLIVEGSASVTGILKGVGQFLWDGIVTLTSTFTAKGTTRFEGDTTQVGPLHIQGATDLTGNLTVGDGGMITVSGGRIYGSAGALALAAGSSGLIVSSSGLLALGSFDASGSFTNSGMPSKAGVVPNVYVDSAGKFWRVS